MTNALNFLNRKNFFDFGDTPIFKSWFDDFSPVNFTNSPKVNVKETDKAYEIEIANPGFGKDETKIEVKDHCLFVSMTSESNQNEDEKDKYHVHQWSKASYSESWNIPENVIEDQIKAKNNDGVLTITMPKKDEIVKANDSRMIEIE
jgi:HSP20 family protein